ncbi:MAG: hypothetical protein IPN44_02905 [Flavobacteriales bacterium]|nr:hypothetical protein [Flavobacteriales bacterium]
MEKVEEKLTYEKAYAELERIMQDLQEDKINVDELTGGAGEEGLKAF